MQNVWVAIFKVRVTVRAYNNHQKVTVSTMSSEPMNFFCIQTLFYVQLTGCLYAVDRMFVCGVQDACVWLTGCLCVVDRTFVCTIQCHTIILY